LFHGGVEFPFRWNAKHYLARLQVGHDELAEPDRHDRVMEAKQPTRVVCEGDSVQTSQVFSNRCPPQPPQREAGTERLDRVDRHAVRWVETKQTEH
jgi:hypothetical protein